MANKVYMDFRAIAPSQSDMRDFLRLLCTMDKLNRMGCSRIFEVDIDGDGSGAPYFYTMTHNATEILETIMNDKKLCAILMGVHPALDELIEKKLKLGDDETITLFEDLPKLEGFDPDNIPRISLGE